MDDGFNSYKTDKSTYWVGEHTRSGELYCNPYNDNLGVVSEMLSSINISTSASPHGSIIRDDGGEYIQVLKDLKGEMAVKPVRKDLVTFNGIYFEACKQVIKHCCYTFGITEVQELLNGSGITLEAGTHEIICSNHLGQELWNKLFDVIYLEKGLKWLAILEPTAKRLIAEFDVQLPSIFSSALVKVEEESEHLSMENIKLKQTNERLNNNILHAKEKLIKCPITGLYNEDFFRKYLQTETSIIGFSDEDYNSSLIVISIDNMSKIKYAFGNAEVEEFLKNIAYILNQVKNNTTHMIFRLQGDLFAYYIPDTDKEEAVSIAEHIRIAVEESEALIDKMTVSIGVVFLDEIIESNMDNITAATFFYDIAIMRVRIAKNYGMNMVCSQSEIERIQDEVGKILIVDTDKINIDILKMFLENQNFKVFVAGDGEAALQIAEKEALDLVISEIMIPKIDGFLVKERLSMHSGTKNIPFIIISYLKNEESVKRAISLNVDYYFKKPYMLTELIGIVKNKIKGEDLQ